MWKQICSKYNNQRPPPPTPTTKAGVVCMARSDAALESKWKRVTPLISYWMRCKNLALRNPKSGESAEGVDERAMSAYMRNPVHKHPFPYGTTYELIKDEPKWLLKHAKIMADAKMVSNAQRESVPEQLARVIDVTSASTKKPKGVKRARRSIAELGEKAKEEKKEEDNMREWLDTFTRKKELASLVLAAANRRSRADQDTANDVIVRTDLSRMTGERLKYYQDRQTLAKQDVKRELKKRVAEEATEVLEAAVATEAAAAFVTAAIATAVTPVTPATLVTPVEPIAPVAQPA